jgi:hypothetical protein
VQKALTLLTVLVMSTRWVYREISQLRLGSAKGRSAEVSLDPALRRKEGGEGSALGETTVKSCHSIERNYFVAKVGQQIPTPPLECCRSRVAANKAAGPASCKTAQLTKMLVDSNHETISHSILL